MDATDNLLPDFDDFERYCSGQMPPAEQRLLEARMLDEPLVAEAYEGFLAWRAPYADAARLRADLHERLHTRASRTRRKALPLWAYGSAASVLLALFVYRVAFWGGRKADTQRPAAIVTQRDQPGSKHGVPEQASPVAQAPAPAIAGPAGAPQLAASAQARREEITPSPGIVAKSAAPASSTAAGPEQLDGKEETDTVSADSELAGKAAAQLAPAPARALAVPGSVQAVGKSMAGRTRATASAPQIVSQKPSGTSSLTENLNEIAATGISSQSKKTAVNVPSEADRADPAPVGGWEAYHVYLDENTASATTTGQVTVTFVVNPTGTLSGFKARGTGELRDEAIRIVRKGPVWLPARTQGANTARLVEVQLQFRRSE
ncbi:hypothetical protein [Dyadobacter sp. 676]|uniref:TonB C-terminal domain-containing protein n=1 Tax=Dyadobacter sp. 676 TaxID=3088362 RepID=A0AAU8FNL6_9BACT